MDQQLWGCVPKPPTPGLMWVTEDTACGTGGTATPQSLMLSTPQTDSVPASGCFPPDPQILGAALPLTPPYRARHLQAESESAVCEERRELWDDSDTPSRLASWLLPHCPTSR